MGPTEIALMAIGSGLIAAAVFNRAPWAVVSETVTGGDAADAPPISTPAVAGTVAGGTAAAGFSAGASTSTSGAPAGMVAYTNPDTPAAGDYAGKVLYMTPATRAGLMAWSAAYGQQIVLTGAYRSTEEQARGHRENPDRYAPPGRSWHERGTAVDVHLAAIGAASGAGLARYLATGQATGWCFAGKSGKMHASFGGCG